MFIENNFLKQQAKHFVDFHILNANISTNNSREIQYFATMMLRPLTPGKRFLLFLPDSHSAYYDSFVSALGRSLPPSLGFSRICCT